MSPRCQNCDSFVTEQYVRVFSRDGETVRACPDCPDMIRDKYGEPRKARSHRGDAADSSGVDDADQVVATDGGSTDA